MKLLIDINLSPKWVSVLKEAGLGAAHWSSIGKPDATNYEILAYAKSNVCFAHDLDFGTILAATKADCPSVIQIRTQNVTPEYLGPLVVSALHQFKKHLEDGAIVTIDQNETASPHSSFTGLGLAKKRGNKEVLNDCNCNLKSRH